MQQALSPTANRLTAAALGAAFLGAVMSAPGDSIIYEPPAPVAHGSFGRSVAIVNDLSFDGYADVLVGIPGDTTGGHAGAGVVHLYDGKSAAYLRSHVSPDAVAGGAFGSAVIGLPDLNSDGRPEYAIGAPGEMDGRGRVYMYSGVNGALIWSGTGLPGTFGHGGCLGVVPDCTGDGKVELAVGNGGGTFDQTSVRIYQAASGLSWKYLNAPQGLGSAARFGHAVSGVPDVDGDGRGDVLVGAPLMNVNGVTDCGAAWIYSGATGAQLLMINSVDPEPSGAFGTAVAGIGDLDGDGHGDVLVGAPREDAVGNDGHGRVHAFSGYDGAPLYTVDLPSPWTGAYFGASIAIAQNFDDDGVPDFAVGAPHAGSSDSGWVFRFSGATGGQIGSMIFGLAQVKGFGSALSAAGDATQDGRSDLLVGAPDSSAGGTDEAGKVILQRLVINDGCSPSIDPVEVGIGGTYFSNVGATNFQSVESTCDGTDPADLGSDVHFIFHAPSSGLLTVSSCATTFDTWIALYRGCDYSEFGCVWGAPDACNDDDASCLSGGSVVTLNVGAGECVRIRVGGVSGGDGDDQGIATLEVAFDGSCDGDLDHDDVINGSDLAILLGAWGTSGIGDLNLDGLVDGADLALLLGYWGSCN